MKRAITGLVVIIMMLTGCGGRSRAPKIEDYTWEMQVVQSGDEGDVIAQIPGLGYDDVPEIRMTCTAEDGKLVMENVTEGIKYTGSYILEDSSYGGVIYKVAFGEIEGYAGTGMTTYMDGGKEPKLNMAFDGYSLSFTP